MKQIHKAAAVIIQDKKLLVTRSKGKSIFVAPGGKLEPEEDSKQALIRELMEELTISATKKDLKYISTNKAPAAHNPSQHLTMDTFQVLKYTGIITPSSEIEEIRWITSADLPTIKLGSIFRHHIIPLLTDQKQID